jgi:hypothetical protein
VAFVQAVQAVFVQGVAVLGELASDQGDMVFDLGILDTQGKEDTAFALGMVFEADMVYLGMAALVALVELELAAQAVSESVESVELELVV